MDSEKLLLAEYKSFTEAFWKNEETGEKRVEFFITITTAIIAGSVALITRSSTNLSTAETHQIVTGALFATLLFGVITFFRMLQRNRVTDEYKEILHYIREQLKEKSVDLSGFKLPFRSQKRLLKGGLAETVALMNSILVSVILVLQIGKGMRWLIVTAVFLLTFTLQVAYSKKDRNKKIQQKNETHSQTFRANVGAVIINADGLVLAFERKKISGSWQFPQGGLDGSESPLDGVKREVREETGIEESHLELLETIPRWLVYELPEELRRKKTGRGQAQKWFLFRFTGPDEAIALGNGKEFKAWKWMSMAEMTSNIVSFKQAVYQELAEEFKSYLEDEKHH